MALGDLSVYVALFLNAFIAATLLPAMSELTLASLILSDTGTPYALFIAATAGNVAGSCLNWWLGVRITRFQSRKWFPFTSAQLARGRQHFFRYGKYSLLFAWVPVIGDPITLVAGMLRTNFLTFIIFVSIGKALRYAAVVYSVTSIG
ncbi:YqaA family protein [Kordiimonas sp.]|uniref:YqaA family protein n=1 Tax=Kordiimonas sp. TaxID=1970157 RepID=UPI003A8FD10A